MFFFKRKKNPQTEKEQEKQLKINKFIATIKNNISHDLTNKELGEIINPYINENSNINITTLKNMVYPKIFTKILTNFVKDKDGESKVKENNIYRKISKIDKEKHPDDSKKRNVTKNRIKILLNLRKLNKLNEHDNTPLMLSIKEKNTELAKLLIKNGCNLDIQNKDGITALMLAAANNHLDIVELLITKGCDLNLQTKKGYTALMYAIKINNIEIAKLLIKSGCILDDKVEKLLVQLTSNGHYRKSSKVNLNNIKSINNLYNYVNYKLNRNRRIEKGYTPLMLAIIDQNTILSKSLITNGKSLNEKSKDGRTPLMLAIDMDNMEIATLLIKKRCELNIQDNNGMTALMYVASSNVMRSLYAARQPPVHDIGDLMIQKGCNLNLQNKDGMTALMFAIEKNNIEMAKLLIGNRNCKLNIKIDSMTPAMFPAAIQNNLKFFISSNGMTALMFAAALYEERSEMARLLIEKGCDLNIQNKDGYTALMIAVIRKNNNIAELLIKNRCKLNLIDNTGNRALEAAIYVKDMPMVRLLIKKGANLDDKLLEMVNKKIQQFGENRFRGTNPKPLKSVNNVVNLQNLYAFIKSDLNKKKAKPYSSFF
jgi:ankyrin repeat protein